MLVRLYRLTPMLVVLAVTALIIYFVSSLRGSKPQAKSNVLKFFTWAFIVLSAFFALATLYAVLEQNPQVTELIGSFLVATLLGLFITWICYRVFVSHYPNYAWKPSRTRVIPWFEQVFKNAWGAVRGKRPEPAVQAEAKAVSPEEENK